jgi:hypothetical protein
MQIINRIWRPGLGVTLSELLAVARDATLNAASRFHPLYGRGGFTTYCKRTINSHLRRYLLSTRVISIPEEKIMLVRKFKIWQAQNEGAATSLSLEEQMAAAGVSKLSAKEFRAALDETDGTSTISVSAIRDAEFDPENNELEDILFSDRGRDASVIRERAFEDPRMAVLRPAFDKLEPLHQGLLATLYDCEATEGGDITWLEHIRATSGKMIESAVERIQTGVAGQTQMARSLVPLY